jgi:hypothetical protein
MASSTVQGEEMQRGGTFSLRESRDRRNVCEATIPRQKGIIYLTPHTLGIAGIALHDSGGGAGAPETDSLEFRLERIKRLSNARFKFLQRLEDKRPVAERYAEGDVHFHLHFLSGNGMFCACYGAGNIQKLQAIGVGVEGDVKTSLIDRQMPVFVGVGQLAETPRPVASLVRLKRLDGCNMSCVEGLEPTALPMLKALGLVLDRELGIPVDLAGIQNGKFIDQIIEGGSEIVTKLADQDAQNGRNLESSFYDELWFAQMLRVTIPLPGNSLSLLLSDDFDLSYKIIEVFFCPSCASEGAV